MKYKLFVADFDGTLGKAPDKIEKPTVSAIKEYEKKGGIFVICTGRMTCSILPICYKYGIKGLVASYQGAVISDINDSKTLLSGGVDYRTAIEIVKKMKKENVQPQIYLDDVLYFDIYNDFSKLYENACGVKGVVVDSLEDLLDEKKKNSIKICALSDPARTDFVVKEITKEFPNVICNKGEKHLIEVINPEYSKGKAVEFLAKHFNIGYDEIITVGDSTNDMTLVQGPWHGVAVGDGMKDLKDVAKEVTVCYNEMPVKVLLEKYCL